MKNITKKDGRGPIVVSALIFIVLALTLVTAEAAEYVNGKKCASWAVELPDGNWKCRTVDNDVAVGPGYSAEKLRPVKYPENAMKMKIEMPKELRDLAK